MRVAGRFRVVCSKDRFFSSHAPGTWSHRKKEPGLLDLRVFPREPGSLPLLLVTTSRKTGGAVARNKFRRRVRMAFLAVLRDAPCPVADGFLLWIRPSPGDPCACKAGVGDIQAQIRASLEGFPSAYLQHRRRQPQGSPGRGPGAGRSGAGCRTKPTPAAPVADGRSVGAGQWGAT